MPLYQNFEQADSSSAHIYPIVELNAGGIVHLIQFEPHSLISMHRTIGSQLFLVIDGHGWVRVNDQDSVDVSQGDMVYWEPFEWHESGTDEGIAVIVIESQFPEPFTLPPGS